MAKLTLILTDVLIERTDKHIECPEVCPLFRDHQCMPVNALGVAKEFTIREDGLYCKLHIGPIHPHQIPDTLKLFPSIAYGVKVEDDGTLSQGKLFHLGLCIKRNIDEGILPLASQIDLS